MGDISKASLQNDRLLDEEMDKQARQASKLSANVIFDSHELNGTNQQLRQKETKKVKQQGRLRKLKMKIPAPKLPSLPTGTIITNSKGKLLLVSGAVPSESRKARATDNNAKSTGCLHNGDGSIKYDSKQNSPVPVGNGPVGEMRTFRSESGTASNSGKERGGSDGGSGRKVVVVAPAPPNRRKRVDQLGSIESSSFRRSASTRISTVTPEPQPISLEAGRNSSSCGDFDGSRTSQFSEEDNTSSDLTPTTQRLRMERGRMMTSSTGPSARHEAGQDPAAFAAAAAAANPAVSPSRTSLGAGSEGSAASLGGSSAAGNGGGGGGASASARLAASFGSPWKLIWGGGGNHKGEGAGGGGAPAAARALSAASSPKSTPAGGNYSFG